MPTDHPTSQPAEAEHPIWRAIEETIAVPLGEKVKTPILGGLLAAAVLLTATGALLLAGFPSWSPWFNVGVALAGLGALAQLGYALSSWSRHVYNKNIDDSVDQVQVATHVYIAGALERTVRSAAGMHLAPVTARRSTFSSGTTSIVKDLTFLPLLGPDSRPKGLRSVLYELNGSKDSLEVVWFDHSSPRKKPQPFTQKTPRGRAAVSWVLDLTDDDHIYVPDIRQAPEEWAGSGGDYNSFISVRVATESKALGMLTLDTPDVDALSENLVPIMKLAASTAAALFEGRNT